MARTFDYMRRMILIQILILLVLSSCGMNKPLSESSTRGNRPDMIVYQDFKAIHEDSKAQIVELKIDEVEGKIKQFAAQPGNFNNPVEVIFLDNADNRISKSFIEHPLINEYEYSSQNGELAKSTQILESATFFVRYNKNSKIKGIRFKSLPNCQILIDQVINLDK